MHPSATARRVSICADLFHSLSCIISNCLIMIQSVLLHLVANLVMYHGIKYTTKDLNSECDKWIEYKHTEWQSTRLLRQWVNEWQQSLPNRGGVTNSSQIPLLVKKGDPISKYTKVWNEHKYGHRSWRGQNQERLCWRRPPAIYWTWLGWTAYQKVRLQCTTEDLLNVHVHIFNVSVLE